VKVSEAESQIARLALENNIVRAYVQLSLQFALKDIAKDTLTHREKALQVIRKRLNAGLVTEMDVTQLEAALPPLHIEIEQHDEAITLLRNQLAALSGKGPTAGEQIQRPTMMLNNRAWLQLPATLPADLIGHRPDVAARRWAVEAQAREIDAAKAAFYPNINLMAFIGFQSIGFSKFFSNESSIRGIGPAISLPIFDGGRLRSNLGARTAVYDASVESYNSTVVHALESVSNALVSAQSLQQQKKLNDDALNTAIKAHTLASKSFGAGFTDFLVLLNSEVALLVQQQQQAQITARMLESHAALMLALGGGYVPELPPVEQAETNNKVDK
jgi:NodT family efflux transporter outer membrane factor (OMF) lipoprotein